MKNHKIYLFATFMLIVIGCKKFLDVKPDARLDVPATLTDFQALLDRYRVMNNSDPASGEISADNYYLFTADYLSLSGDNFRNIYTWQKDNLFVPQTNDWFNCYSPVFICNTILAGLANVQVTGFNRNDYNDVKGQALYARGRAFFMAAGLWAMAYDSKTAAAQPGIPIRLGIDFNEKSVRSSVQDSYSQIINDLSAAAALLPVMPVSVERPSKPAAFAMLARTYLDMGDYDQAGLYADSCLQLCRTLVDYNTLDPTARYPLQKFNPEVIHESLIATPQIITNADARIDTNLYASYAANDLRKTIFFTQGSGGSQVFRGSYEGGGNLFSGIATDEVYLIRAECLARTGNVAGAMEALNTLLVNRFASGTFVPRTATSGADALMQVLAERRKELIMRGLRWMDLKRLNLSGAGIALSRMVNGQTYTLPANDVRYALPIPDDIIQLSGMQQNPR